MPATDVRRPDRASRPGRVRRPGADPGTRPEDGRPRQQPNQAHREAAGRVIHAMKERLHEPITVESLARVAYLSPFHFSRVFRRVTGVTPGRFLAAVRLQEAKRLLLTTNFSVTAVCFEVGYNSVGTFSRLFTEFVGIQPSRLRREAGMVAEVCGKGLRGLKPSEADVPDPKRRGPEVAIVTPEDACGPVFTGVFPEPIPRGEPAACMVVPGTGRFRLPPVEDGRYYLFVACMDADAGATEMVTGSGVLRGRSRAFNVRDGAVSVAPVRVTLRPPGPLDPPLLLSLPFAFARARSIARDRSTVRPRRSPDTRNLGEDGSAGGW